MGNKITLKGIQQSFFRVQMVLIISLALFLGIAGTLINIHFERQKRDQNLQNVAEAIAQSPILMEQQSDNMILTEYLDSLRDTLDNIDVISIVDSNLIRLYHSNHELINTSYDGTIPKFNNESEGYYAANDHGPSGTQRRAYAAIYDEDGNYIGFVMAIMLMQNIHKETWQTAFVFMLITIAAILMELLISTELSSTIKKSLMGYEPDVFSAMYRIRDNILESLDEGIIAIDNEGNVQFVNGAAEGMLNQIESGLATRIVGENINNLQLGSETLLIDRMPIKEKEICVGEIAILHDRAEYTKLMEDLTGTRYLVDSMRANNHDFTNKLHVILGLIQMEMYDKAVSYIENITIVQRSTISKIMNIIQEPAVAALLIGKTARASELNVKFVLREGCFYSNADMQLPSELLVTIIGNLIENAFEAMNDNMDYNVQKELIFGIYSRPGAVLITTDDTGVGISEENLQRIFDNGFSTKGEGRGTGLYQVKEMVERYGGIISVESQEGVGSSFSVSFTK
ncbi:MAG: ATP-binding protein [Faecalimonas sp.]|nr:ATP-binding protein [Faecalimonas sp.]